MSKYAVVFEAERTGYSISDVRGALTVGEVKEILEGYDDDDLFILSHDEGYTYGSINRYPEHRDVDDEEEE